MRVSSVLAYWTRTDVVMRLSPGQVNLFLFYAAAMLLFNIIQIIYMPEVCILRKSIVMCQCMTLLQVALVSIPLHKFVSPPCWYYPL
jgi:hypothetical protein